MQLIYDTIFSILKFLFVIFYVIFPANVIPCLQELNIFHKKKMTNETLKLVQMKLTAKSWVITQANLTGGNY